MIEEEKRGGRVSIQQVRDKEIRELVENHIDRFPRIPTGKKTKKQYLSSDLTLTKMHQMFCEEQTDSLTKVSFNFYSKIVHEKNITFLPTEKAKR